MITSPLQTNPWLGALLVVVAMSLAVLLAAPFLARQLLFLSPSGDPGAAPELAGVEGRDLHIETDDGVRLHGWWFEAGADPGSAPPPAALLLHGNAGSIAGRTSLGRGLLERGISVLALSYRGYGRSDGRADIRGIGIDAAAGLDFLAERAGGYDRVVVHGRSLGGAAALQGFRDRNRFPAGLVLESTFTSLIDIARSVYPFLPRPLLVRLCGLLDARRVLGEWEGPVLIVHGSEDRIVPVEMARSLHSVARDPRGFWIVEGAGHNDLEIVAGPAAHAERIAAFILEVTSEASSAGSASP